jgi:hypothetical protein
MFYRVQRFTTNKYKDKRKGSKQTSEVYRRQPWSGAPDCPVCHRTVSGAPGRNDFELASVVCRRHLMRYSARLRAQKSEQAPEGTLDSLQDLSGAPLDCPVAPIVRAPTVGTQWPGDVAGAPDSVRWRTGLSGAPVDRSPHQWFFWWLGL